MKMTSGQQRERPVRPSSSWTTSVKLGNYPNHPNSCRSNSATIRPFFELSQPTVLLHCWRYIYPGHGFTKSIGTNCGPSQFSHKTCSDRVVIGEDVIYGFELQTLGFGEKEIYDRDPSTQGVLVLAAVKRGIKQES